MKNKAKPLPTQQELHKLFHCVGGRLIRAQTHFTRSFGKVVGNDNGSGYKFVMIKGKNYYLHRLIWMWYYGIDPGDDEIDHKDKDKNNNNIWNLQQLTYEEHVLKDSKGYSYNVRWGKWVIYKRVNGKNVQVAHYKTEEECILHLSDRYVHYQLTSNI
tara:strand:+ start:85 stop:558 length:474 start_codon:yes stop_codon:yes gene_type:complete